MVLMMLLNLFVPGAVYAADINTSILTSITKTITQNNVTILSGGAIDSTKPIRVDISFGVPVLGDEGATIETAVTKGAVVVFEISDAFTLTSSSDIELKMGTIKVGTATFSTTSPGGMVVATVVFDGDDEVFDGNSNTVTAQFGAEFSYNGSGDGGSTGNPTVTIMEKTYTVNVPALPIVYGVTKSGTANLSEQSITWNVQMQASQGGLEVDLAGYEFRDDLQKVGEYIEDSFQVDGIAVSPTTTGGLSYIFPVTGTSSKAISFKTKIADSDYLSNVTKTITNTAILLTGGSIVANGTGNVSFKPVWIAKTGMSSDAGSSGVYVPNNRTITWTITANQMGASLNGVVITDLISGPGLTFASATWEKWDGSNWIASTSITPTGSGIFEIGDINTKILLTIVTNVPDEAYATGTTNYTNTANIKWTGLTGAGIGTGNVNVGVGFNAISKSGEADAKNQKIGWTVKVDTKEQNIPELKVYDLLIYGKTINLAAVSGIPISISASALTACYGQKYIDNFSGNGSLTVTSIAIMQGGVQVGDLLEITGLSTTTVNSFSFDSQVVDPDIFAGNKTSTVSNTATLFSANTKLNQATVNVDYTNSMLQKAMLKREGLADPVTGVNNSTTTATAGFDYLDKSAIFRISVNADGIDLTSTTNASGQALGATTVTDQLPAGWEFLEVVSGSGINYLIFEGTGNDGTVQAVTPAALSVATANFNISTVAFTFTTLDKPYVILLKARPTSAAALEYFSKNQTITKTNTVNLKTENWATGISSTQDVKITSQLLSKNATKVSNGELRWTVNYKPYDLAQPGQRIEDQLPLGIDLRMTSSGSLLLDEISVNELTLNADGSYAVASPVALVLGTNVSYDNSTRVLSFTIPDSAKSYRFSYLTDITGEPGTSITNKVSLLGGGSTQEGTSDSYSSLTLL